MILKGISVNQDPPTKDYLWITPKGNTRFWNQSTWKVISGNGGGGDLSNYYTKAETNGLLTGYLPLTGGTLSGQLNVQSSVSVLNNVSANYLIPTTNSSNIGNENNIWNYLWVNNIRIGNAIISWDSTNGGIHIYNVNNSATAGIYADWVSALGANSGSGGGGGGGMDEIALWQELTDDLQWELGDDKIINVSHLPNNINADTVDGYHANSFAFANGTNATGTWGISISGNAATATKATQDGNGNTISSTYLPLAGGTMTGNLNLKANQYNREGALNCNNSDIINVNSILTANAAENFGEGLCFYRSASTWDCMSASNGTFYFGSNKAYSAAFAGDAAIRCGNITTTAISGGDSSIRIKSANDTNVAFIGSGSSTPVSGGEYGIVQLYQNGTEMHRLYAHPSYSSWVCYGAGNFGIGTNSPAYKLDVAGDINTSNYVRSIRFLTKASANANYAGLCAGNQITGSLTADDGALYYYGKKLWVWATELRLEGGNIVSTGAVTALVASASDKRLKKEIKPFDAKQIIDKLKPVEFEWNKKANKYNSNLELNKKNYGLIAQDSDGIIDNLVFDLPDGKGYKGVRYEKLIPILLQAVKEQQKEIDELKQIIKKLKV